MNNTNFEYEICKSLMLGGLLQALEIKKPELSTFLKHPIGTTTIHRMCLDIHPWHNSIMISFCHEEDNHKDIATWRYFHFIGSETEEFPLLKQAANYITTFYDPTYFMEDDEEFEEWEENEDEEIDSNLKAHIIFLAGAEVILNEKVAHILRECGIDTAPIFEHPLQGYRSDFFLVENNNNDQIEANYCDIVRANRATEYLFSELAKSKK